MRSSRKSQVPSGRLSRLWHLGNAATRLAAGGALEVTQRWLGKSAGEHPALLTVENARALADRMSRLRGAAMKLGQMLSLEGDSLLPKEFAEALAVLRDSADTMPEEQVRAVLVGQYGPDWESSFRSFEFEPLASASIGQVHRATAADGRRVALKIQYPGIAQSIDSDVDNLASLLNLSRILPVAADVGELTAEVKRQLHEEVDYERELAMLEQYRGLVADFPWVRVPRGYADLTTPAILAMEYVYATPLSAWSKQASQQQRDTVGGYLIELLLSEFFRFALVQTDPNLSNFFYDAHNQQLVLFDFGAARPLSREFREVYRGVLEALLGGAHEQMHDALLAAGFINGEMPEPARQVVTRMALCTHEVFERPGRYDFGASTLPARFHALKPEVLKQRAHLEPPPAPLLFFQRKLSGTFLICRGLGARVDCRELVQRHVLTT